MKQESGLFKKPENAANCYYAEDFICPPSNEKMKKIHVAVCA
jgi:hypothetical protein